MSEKSKTIAELNDRMRKSLITFKVATDVPRDRIVLTPGVQALVTDPEAKNFIKYVALLRVVAEFNTFTEDNDPWGEHDFGSFEFEGEGMYWKIDYYDLDLKYGSDDPSDPSQTVRVLTIMLRSEY